MNWIKKFGGAHKCLGVNRGSWIKCWYSFKAWFDRRLTKRMKWKCCVLRFGSEAGVLHISQSQSPQCLRVWQPMASKRWHFRDPGEPITENVIRPLKKHLPVFFTNTTQTLAFSLPSLHPSAPVLWPDRRAGERLLVQRLKWGVGWGWAQIRRKGRLYATAVLPRCHMSVLMVANTHTFSHTCS